MTDKGDVWWEGMTERKPERLTVGGAARSLCGLQTVTASAAELAAHRVAPRHAGGRRSRQRALHGYKRPRAAPQNALTWLPAAAPASQCPVIDPKWESPEVPRRRAARRALRWPTCVLRSGCAD
jgi:GTP-dependent phosphoenolpyruvate carboxykinase